MARYAKGRVRAHHVEFWDAEEQNAFEPSRMSLTVDDHEAVDTGLIWSTGEPIMRVPSPMGFGRDEEW